MSSARFQFHPGFAPLIPARKRRGNQLVHFQGSPTVKHVLEGFGIPHTEVGELTANGRPVDLSYPLLDGDSLVVYPVRTLETALNPGAPPAFVLDNHLGRLAAFLRILGFDVLYRNDIQDQELAGLAAAGERILLTRDRGLLMRKAVMRGYWVRNLDLSAQLVEVVRRYGLLTAIRPFKRCPVCNALLQPVEKAAVLAELEPLTRLYYHEFHRCPACGKIYWRGSHVERILQRIEQLKAILWAG